MGTASLMKPLIKPIVEPLMALFFCLNLRKGREMMCLMDNKPVGCRPCRRCPEYLNSCMPLVINGFIYGECDEPPIVNFVIAMRNVWNGGAWLETVKL